MGLGLFLSQKFGQARNWCGAHESELWLTGSIIFDVVTVVSTVFATNKANENRKKHEENVEVCKTAHEKGECENGVEYTQDDYDKDRVCEAVRYGLKQAATFAVPVGSAAASAYCGYKCYDHQKKTIVGLSGALTGAMAFISQYMARTKEVVGEEKELEIRTGLKQEEVTEKVKDPETGKMVKTKVKKWKIDPLVPDDNPLLSPYAIRIDKDTTYSLGAVWDDDIHMSSYLNITRSTIQKNFDLRARSNQKFYLDEALELIHICPTSLKRLDWDTIRILGWCHCDEYKDSLHPERGIQKLDWDKKINIGYPIDDDDDLLTACKVVRDATGAVYLDFNVMGPIQYIEPVPYPKEKVDEIIYGNADIQK